MLQKLAQENDQHKRGRPRKRGQRTAEGQQRQIAARISNGVHFQSPVLPGGIESQEAWEAHLAKLEEALQPVGAWEKLCVYRIALSAWKHFRLVRHEAAIVSAAILSPNDTFLASYDNEVPGADCVAEVLARSACELAEEFSQRGEFLLRIRALTTDNGEGVAFTAIERRQILSGIIQQLTYDDEGEEDSGQDYDENEGADLDDGVPIFDGENRTWSAAKVQEQLRILCEAAGEDWRAKLYYVLYDYRHELEERLSHLAEAKEHITYGQILGMEELDRLCLYERQISASFRHLVSQLERHQARRLGVPVPAPLAVDLSVSHHGALPEIP